VQRRGIVLPVVRRVSTIAVADRIVALAPKGRDQQARARRSHHRNWWKRRTHSMSTMQAHALPRHADRRGSAAPANMVFLCSSLQHDIADGQDAVPINFHLGEALPQSLPQSRGPSRGGKIGRWGG